VDWNSVAGSMQGVLYQLGAPGYGLWVVIATEFGERAHSKDGVLVNHSCRCDLGNQCCEDYERCVSCCLDPQYKAIELMLQQYRATGRYSLTCTTLVRGLCFCDSVGACGARCLPLGPRDPVDLMRTEHVP